MEWIEISAKTVQLAVDKALDTLGVHETELEHEVLEEAKSGLFGLRRTEARIRARVKPISREKPHDKRRRKQREDRKSRGPKDGVSGQRKQTDLADAADESDQATSQPKRAPKAKSQKPDPQRQDVGAARDKPKNRPKSQKPDNEPQSSNDSPQREVKMNGSIEEQLECADQFGRGLIEAFGVEASSAAAVVADDVIELAITGQNLGLLVGPKAATLAALEEILRGSVGHRGPARLHLDVASYRQKRREALGAFAKQVARDVATSGEAKALEPMSAPDRKVVHDAVAEIEGVMTISDGEDQQRRVLIQPAV